FHRVFRQNQHVVLHRRNHAVLRKQPPCHSLCIVFTILFLEWDEGKTTGVGFVGFATGPTVTTITEVIAYAL
ncbi:MAG: hypothetical protein K2Q10_00685, partial [Rhodospirillales bacterium]|nr:hypothetical protein [Rhodospirillales bacterium]